MTTAKLKMYGQEHEICFARETYSSNHNLAIEALEIEDGIVSEPLCSVTVNLIKEDGNKAFIDINNCNEAIVDWLLDNNYAKFTGREVPSGFCVYPEVEFSDEFLTKVVI